MMEEKIDIKDSVMQRIKREKIGMRHPFVFLAKKLGMQSALVLAILGNAILISVLLYFLKKTGLLKFLAFGWSGLKVILLSLPYDFVALFLMTLVLAAYLVKRIDFAQKSRVFANMPTVTLLLMTVFIGTFFALMGFEQIAKSWVKNKLPEEIAVYGKIVDAWDRQIIVEYEDGRRGIILYDDEEHFPFKPEYAKNKLLRAVGQKDSKHADIFYADDISCCEKE